MHATSISVRVNEPQVPHISTPFRTNSATTMLLSYIIIAVLVVLAWNPLDYWAQDPLHLKASSKWDTEEAFSKLEDYVVEEKYSLLKLHRSLMEIESISGNEYAVANFLTKYLKNTGLTVETQQVEHKRYNIYAYYGNQRNTSTVISSHIDVVPPYIGYSVDGTKIRGRGACDDKGPLAAQVIAFLDLLAEGKLKEGDASLLFVVGEENSGIGMRTASDKLGVSWDYAIFGEPTENKLGVGHKGIFAFDVEVNGRACHSGYPELGVSATDILVPILHKIQNLDLPKSDLLGPSTVNIGKIEAGVAANVVPAYGKATIAIRVAAELEEVVRLVHTVVDGVEHVVPVKGRTTEPQYLDHEVPGYESIILAYNTDVPNLKQPLKKRFLYGPGTIHVAHSEDEHVENKDLLDSVVGYKGLVEHLLAL